MIARAADEHGAVAVLVAVLIVPMTLLLAFAIDTGSWWTHHRHLQTQADAGALAGALGPWLPACDEAGIERAAQDYSGPPYNPQYTDQQNVTVLLNSTNYSDQGGSNFSDTGKPCDALAANHGFLDLKATETNATTPFPILIPGFPSATIHTHARVEIQALQEEGGVRPIAVRDDSAYLCAQAQLWSTNTDGTKNALLATIPLPSRTTNPDGSTRFQNPGGSGNIAMPAGTNVAVTVNLGNAGCATVDSFPDQYGGGLSFINVYNANGAPPAGAAPRLHSVSIPPALSNCTPDPYFSTNGCDAVVKAYVDFAPGAVTSNPGQNAFVTVNGAAATAGTDSGGLYWTADVPVAAQSGPHTMTIAWQQKYGTVSGTNCAHGQGCSGTFNVQQQAFSATSDDSGPNSGAISRVQVGEVGGSLSGANSFQQGTAHNLVFTVDVAGLSNSKPSDPPTIIRYNVQGSKRTGAVDCGEGTGANGLQKAIAEGCPDPIYLWKNGDCGPPPPNAAPDNVPVGTPIDCVGIVPGNKRGPLKQAFIDLVGTSCDNWNAWKASNGTLTNFPPVGDPRVITVLITSPADLSGGGGSTADVPVVQLATFYITGGDGLKNPGGPGCGNEPYPGGGSSNGSIWGHFIKYVPPGGISGNGNFCNPNAFGDCVAVLTQ